MLNFHYCRSVRRLLIAAILLSLLTPASAVADQFTRGDVDANGTVDLHDARLLFAYLRGRRVELTCPDAADTDDNGVVNFKDIRRSLRYLFREGLPPAAPGPMACGEDPTPDSLGACVFDACPQVTDGDDASEPWSPFESYLPVDRSAELLSDLRAARLQGGLEAALRSPGDNITLEFNGELAVSLEGIEISSGISVNPSVTLTEDRTYEIAFAYSKAKGLGVGINENIGATITESQSANTVFEFGNVSDTAQALQAIVFGEFLAPSLNILTEAVVTLEITLQAIDDLEGQLPSLEQAADAADAALREAKAVEDAAEDVLDGVADTLKDAERAVEDLLGRIGAVADALCALIPGCPALERQLAGARADVASLESSLIAATRAFDKAVEDVDFAKEARKVAKNAEDAVDAEIAALRAELANAEAGARAARMFLETFDDGTRLLEARLSRVEFVMAAGANVSLFLAPFEGVSLANAGVGASLSPQDNVMLTLELDETAMPSGVTILVGTEFSIDVAGGFFAGLDAAATLTSDTKVEFQPDLGRFNEAGVTLELGLDAQVVGLVGIGLAVEAGAGREIGISVEAAELGPLLSSVRELVAAGSTDGLRQILADAEATASLQDRRIGGGLFLIAIDEVGSLSGSATWSQVGESLEKPLTNTDDLLDLFGQEAVESLLETLANEVPI
jgi:hypothetical protein